MKARALLVICLALYAVPALSQGQKGAFDDAMRMYEQLLNDPDLDAATKAQVRANIRQLQESSDNMSSAVPTMQNDVRSSSNYGGSNNSQGYTPSEEQRDQGNSGSGCDGCVQSAQ
jgi:hypothetical protein